MSVKVAKCVLKGIFSVYFNFLLYKTNRLHVAVRLFSNRSQRTSKCGENIKMLNVSDPFNFYRTSFNLRVLQNFSTIRWKHQIKAALITNIKALQHLKLSNFVHRFQLSQFSTYGCCLMKRPWEPTISKRYKKENGEYWAQINGSYTVSEQLGLAKRTQKV